MLQVLQNVSLKPYNTFGIDVPAQHYVEVTSEEEVQELSSGQYNIHHKWILGGGSNILLTRPVEGLVIRNCLRGIEIAEENEEHVWVNVKAGVVWHELVMHTIQRNWSGLENLSLIPGCVGASPMQNIGAYGVEVKETIDEVVGWHWDDKAFVALKNNECKFGYRDSIFKHELKDRILITSVTFKLNKINCFNTSYGAIQQELETMGVSEPSIKAISDAVISIRSSKLPDPKKIGNAGSFFKNPTIAVREYDRVKQHYPSIPCYPVNSELVKIPAGWLIEQAGLKGYKEGEAGVHDKQALVLVNYGNATGEQIWKLSEKILTIVNEKFGIVLEREVNVW
jgi:UDP-N-acetylmuramate dehydrogenase